MQLVHALHPVLDFTKAFPLLAPWYFRNQVAQHAPYVQPAIYIFASRWIRMSVSIIRLDGRCAACTCSRKYRLTLLIRLYMNGALPPRDSLCAST
jgi:hypothetical protein